MHFGFTSKHNFGHDSQRVSWRTDSIAQSRSNITNSSGNRESPRIAAGLKCEFLAWRLRACSPHPLLPSVNRTVGENQGLPVRNFMFVIHLILEGVRGNCRTSMFSRPFSNAAAAAMSVMGDGERERERQVANRTSHRMWAGWTDGGRPDGRTQRERRIFAL